MSPPSGWRQSTSVPRPRLPNSAEALPAAVGRVGGGPGTVWTGMWVVAHECGRAAFSDNRLIQDTVGYILHTLLLVPYFSWQHSHAVHHAHTNHITKGETHVPHVVGGQDGIENPGGERELAARVVGKGPYGALQMFLHLVVGWPAYLLWGATGGPKYGTSNHFVPRWPFNAALWPGKWAKKVLQSDIGIVGMCAALFGLSMKFGALAVFALYGAPLIFTNMWLVGYTWLQHTDVDIPHLTDKEFSYMRGAFLTVDRPYGPIFDWFHHRIGSTHVAHHIDCTITTTRRRRPRRSRPTSQGLPVRRHARPQGPGASLRTASRSSCGRGRAVHMGARLKLMQKEEE